MIELKITILPENRVRFYAKSEAVEDYFRERSTGILERTQSDAWSHLQKYDLDYYPNGSMYHAGRWGYRRFYIDRANVFNLSLFRAVGLSEGVEVELDAGLRLTNAALRHMELYTKKATRHFLSDCFAARFRSATQGLPDTPPRFATSLADHAGTL